MENRNSRFKLLITNIVFFGGLKVFSSLFPLLILPYITFKLGSAEAFGAYDIFTVIGSFLCSISMLGVQEAMFRQCHIIENIAYRKKVNSTSTALIFITSFITSGIFLLFKDIIYQSFFQGVSDPFIIYFIVLYAIVQNMMNMAVHPSRIVNNRKHLLLNTLIYALLYYGIVILFLEYSFGIFALIYGQIIAAGLLMLTFFIINRKIIFPLKIDWEIVKPLLRIGIPLMPIFVIYWANTSVARMLIVKYLGASELGVFAIGSKYASISTFLQAAFAGGWSYFTFSTMNDSDQKEMKEKIFHILFLIIIVAYALITPIAPWFYKSLFTGDYIRGYSVFNQLFLSPLFLILYQIIANQFTIAGKSYFSLISLGSGVLTGLVLCVILLQNGSGIVGVSYTIPIGYLLALLIASFWAVKMHIFFIGYKSYIAVLFIIIINLLSMYFHGLVAYMLFLPFLFVLFMLNKADILELKTLIGNFAITLKK